MIEHIAKLASLSFDEKQLKLYTKRFSKVLEYVDKLKELKTEDVEPMAHAMDITCPMREDKNVKFAGADGILESAPEKDGRFVQVPRVI